MKLFTEEGQQQYLNERLSNNVSDIPSIVFEGQGKLYTLFTPLENDEHKYLLTMALRKLMDRYQVTEYVLTTEAWFSKNTNVPPSMAPDRKEVMLVTRNSGNGDEMMIWPIHRDTKGNGVVTKPDLEMSTGIDHMQGLFVDLLDPMPYRALKSTTKRKVDKIYNKLIKGLDPLMVTPTIH
jgi:hypothetical protein